MLRAICKILVVAIAMIAWIAPPILAEEGKGMDMTHSSMSMGGDSMTMHHMHLMINHAVEMATEGSSLAMIGQMKMAPGVDDISIKHGRMMIGDAKNLIKQIMSDKTMTDMHAKGVTIESSPEMAYTHKLSQAAMSYITLLEQMAPAP